MTMEEDYKLANEVSNKLKTCSITESLNYSFILRNLYQKILINDLEKALDNKIEQLLWENALKKQITFFQRKINTCNYSNHDTLVARFNVFLDTATGFYIKLIQCMDNTFDANLHFREFTSNKGIFQEYKSSVKVKSAKNSSILYTCQNFMIHLGDIARYRGLTSQAYTFYKHASEIVPYNGQAYNQLAILECGSGTKLGIVYLYVQALSVTHPFYSARVNLHKVFRKVAKDTRIDLNGKLYVTEVQLLFIKVVSLICLQLDIEKAKQCLSRVLTAFSSHLSTLFVKQNDVICIAIYAMGVAGACLNRCEFSRRHIVQQFYDCSVQLIVGIFESLLLAAPKQEGKLKQSNNLSSIRIIVNWLYTQDIQNENEVINSLELMNYSIWQNFCKILNTLYQNYSLIGDYDEINPLPEDIYLQYFVPLEATFKNLEFTNQDFLTESIELDLRIHRLIQISILFCDKFKSKNFFHVGLNNGRMQFIQTLTNKDSNTEKKASTKNDNINKEVEINSQKRPQSTYSLFGQGKWNSPISKGQI